MTEIRDPVHGPITIDRAELGVVDSIPFQRLRNIKQLGFAEMTFPGSTHTRYLHSLGVMHLAGRVFDTVFAGADWLGSEPRRRFRQSVRLAALLHDVGHPPLSHTVERLLPPRSEIALPGPAVADDVRATHEEMGRALILSPALAGPIEDAFADLGISSELVAGILSPSSPLDESAYRVAGRNLRPILCQIISSELDVDRMDYLLRDSYFTGATYGRFDHDWLIRGLTFHCDEAGQINLALNERAVLTFEDFLLSRYHMFVMVYFHQRINAYDRMLLRFFESLDPPFSFPADLERYCEFDDAHLHAILRQHRDDPWSERILQRRPIRLVLDLAGDRARAAEGPLDEALRAAGIEPEWIASTGVLSKYYARAGGSNDLYGRIFVEGDPVAGRRGAMRLEEATELFSRYREPAYLQRLHVERSRVDEARSIASRVMGELGLD
jgi:HD superfamily phosphohydrolase